MSLSPTKRDNLDHGSYTLPGSAGSEDDMGRGPFHMSSSVFSGQTFETRYLPGDIAAI